MLQIVSNLNNHDRLTIPANAQYILFIMQNIANFKVLQEPNVQRWMQENVFGHFQTAQKVIMGQGTMIFGMLAIFSFLAVLLILKVLLRSSTLVEKL
jgi:hypothetical protein